LANCMRRTRQRFRDERNDPDEERASFFLLGYLYNREAELTDLAITSRGVAVPLATSSTPKTSKRNRAIRAQSPFEISREPLTITIREFPNHRHRESQSQRNLEAFRDLYSGFPIDPRVREHLLRRKTIRRWAKIRASENLVSSSSTMSPLPIPENSNQERSTYWSDGTHFDRS